MRIFGKPLGTYPIDESATLTIHLDAPASKNSQYALSLYLLNTFLELERAGTPDARWEAARWFARCPGLIPQRFKNPKVRQRLAEEAERRGRAEVRHWLQQVVFPQAVMQVVPEFSRPRRIRLGREWVADEQGRIVPRKPERLPVMFGARWIRQAVRARADAIILDQDTANVSSPPAETPHCLRPLFRYLTHARITDRDRKLLLSWTRPTAETAAALGCSVGAVRQRRHRLLRKLKGL